MINKISLTAIRPLNHKEWLINGDALGATPFARLIAPEGFDYRIVSGLSYATYHGRDGVQAREIEFGLKDEVSQWHSAILFNMERHRFVRIRVGWIDYDPSDMARLAQAQWDAVPEVFNRPLLRYNLSQAYWEKFMKGQIIDSPFHAEHEGWQLCPYTPQLWQRVCNLAQQIDALQEALEELVYAD